jgi:cell division protein FtsB
MRQFEKRRKIRQFIYSKLVILVLIFFIVLIAKGTWGVYQKSKISLERRDLAMIELQEVNERKSDLEQDIARLESRVGIEEELRTRYSLSKDGEQVVIIIDEDPQPEAVDEEEKGLIKRTMSLFKKLNLLE